jgi:predicted MFS family arabinose efflux permease
MRRLLLVASLIYAIAGTAGLYLSSLPLLLVSRMFVGASAACIQVMSLILVNTRLDGPERAKWMGLHVSIAIFCSLAIFPLSGFLGDIGWRLPFLEYLFGLVVFAILLFSRDQGGPQTAAQAKADAGPAGGPPLIKWMPWHYVLLSLLVGAITFLPTIYLPFLFRERAQLEPSGIAGIMFASALVGGISAMLFGRVRSALSAHVTFVCCFGLAAIGMLIVALSPGLPGMILGLMIYGIGNSWFVPNVMTSLGGKLASYQQARAAGLVKAGHFVSTPLMVVLVEPFARRLGAASVMLLASGMATFVVVLMLLRMATVSKRQAVPAE